MNVRHIGNLACLLSACVVADIDEDGFAEPEDCDDRDASLNPDVRELCDGIDNNCNGVVDEGTTTTFYSDADQDGYGDPASATELCAPGPGHLTDSSDCDDSRPRVHPYAPERCNGVDDDCDAETVDGYGAYFVDKDGTTILIGLTDDPEQHHDLVFDTDGTARFCSGAYRVNLAVHGASVTIENAGTNSVVLDGVSGVGPVLTVDSANVDVSSVRLQNGIGAPSTDGVTYGGLAACSGDGATLAMADMGFIDGAAHRGGAIAAFGGCDLTLTGAIVAGTAAIELGGGLFLNGGTHLIQDTLIANNRSQLRAGGVHIGGGATVSMAGVEVRENTSEAGAGGVEVVDSDLTWTTSDLNGSRNGGNKGEPGSGLFLQRSSFSATNVDFTTAGGADDNQGLEIALDGIPGGYGANSAATFRCDAEVCGVSEPYELGEHDELADVGATASTMTAANFVVIDRQATLDTVEVFVGSTGSCIASVYVLTALDRNPGRGTRWSVIGGYALDIDGAPAWRASRRLGVVMHPGWSYAIGVRAICETGEFTWQRGIATAEVLDVGTYRAWARGESEDLEGFSSVEFDGEAWRMRLNVTAL